MGDRQGRFLYYHVANEQEGRATGGDFQPAADVEVAIEIIDYRVHER
jgi:hypothetical protein